MIFMENIFDEISRLESKIQNLPQGNISKKNINGKDYYYYRITINGKRKETYISFEEAKELGLKIEERKSYERLLKELMKYVPKSKISHLKFNLNVKIKDELNKFSNGVSDLKKRFNFSILNDYIYNDKTEKVFILYGLRRTGKTTMIRQVINEMDTDYFNKTAFIQVSHTDQLSSLKEDLIMLEKNNYNYVFIDEITLLEDFIEGAALLSDIFSTSGMKIVLSGTDSLSFIFSSDESLYDRCILLHTTYISYKEFEEVLDIKGIDKYILYGGTMSLSGNNYNNYLFKDKNKVNEYVDSAIAKNICHSLKYYQNSNYFRGLYELFINNELVNAINRVVEDMNHRFTIDVITKIFKSNDLALSRRNLRIDPNTIDILDRINVEEVTNKLMNKFDIKNNLKIEINDDIITEIKEYLILLDFIKTIKIVNMSNSNKNTTRIAFIQPGIRYQQAKSLVESLNEDDEFLKVSLKERNIIIDRILNEIKGRMVEDIILVETANRYPNLDVFKCEFAVGEFDMVISDRINEWSKIFEIKYSDKIVSKQYRHLIDKDKCEKVEFRFGKIIGKYVLYRGENTVVDDINYINIEKYLKEGI